MEEKNFDKFQKAFSYLCNFVIKKQWLGACHAVTAVLFGVAKRLEIESVPCIGEVKNAFTIFDHSWLEINGKKFDIAIIMPLNMAYATGPVFNDMDLTTNEPIDMEYGVEFEGLGDQAMFAYAQDIYSYMKACPNPDLIDLLKRTCSSIGVYVSDKWIRENLSDERWVLRK